MYGEIKWASLAKSASMIRIMANNRAPSARGIFSPLRYAVFRRIWTASLLSNLGILVLGVGAAWTMTQISSSADMVALVQTSLMLPVALVSTPAGAIADMFDRRIVGLVALAIALVGSISLSALAWLGVVTPVLLLVTCFIIGSGMALFGPAWQASVSEQVPAEALARRWAISRRRSRGDPPALQCCDPVVGRNSQVRRLPDHTRSLSTPPWLTRQRVAHGRPRPRRSRNPNGPRDVRLLLKFFPPSPVTIRLQTGFLHRDAGEDYFPFDWVKCFVRHQLNPLERAETARRVPSPFAWP